MSSNPPAKDDEAPWFVQEHGKFMRIMMRICLIAFCVMDALNIAAAVYILVFDTEKSTPYPVLFSVFIVSFWTAWVLLAIWLVLETERSRLCLFETHMTQRGISRTRRIEWKDVTAIYWGSFGGSITVANAQSTICIPLRRFTFKSCHDELIKFFRLQFSNRIQVSYEFFKASRLLPALSVHKPLRMTEKLAGLLVITLFLLSAAGIFTSLVLQSGLVLWLGFGIWILAILIGLAWRLRERQLMHARLCRN